MQLTLSTISYSSKYKTTAKLNTQSTKVSTESRDFAVQNLYTAKTAPMISLDKTQNFSTAFLGSQYITNDHFERKSNDTEIKLFSPFSHEFYTSNVNLNKEQSRVFKLKNPKSAETDLIVEYNPSRTGVLYDKTNGRPFAVNILKSSTDNFPNSVAYHFMSKDLKHEFGYVQFYKPTIDELGDSELTKDYPKYGIEGERIEVLYLRNYNDKKIGGIGKLADKMAVRYCQELGIEPNIVSYADEWSHVAHYKRGKRFIPPQKGTDEYDFLKTNYGKTDPNSILKNIIESADNNNEDVDLLGWGYLMMYLPKELAEKYKQR